LTGRGDQVLSPHHDSHDASGVPVTENAMTNIW
jgi:hypothetical protein